MIDYLKYIADSLHLCSFLILIINMQKQRNCLGVSYRTIEIYLVVFLLRYSDIFFLPQRNHWNLFCKLSFITMTIYIIYLMKFKRPICVTYEATFDQFPHRITLYPRINFFV